VKPQSSIEFNAEARNIQVSNIEILNSLGRGLAFTNSMSELIVVEDMYIHHTQGDTGSVDTIEDSYGVGGGLFLNGPNDGTEIHVRNCFFEVNNLVT